jgi:transposase
MRKGFDSLHGLVTQQMQLYALNGSVYIFINKKRNQVKLLHWEGDGFALYYKRLEKGTYELPVPANNNGSISAQELQLILQGIQLRSIKMKKRYTVSAL